LVNLNNVGVRGGDAYSARLSDVVLVPLALPPPSAAEVLTNELEAWFFSFVFVPLVNVSDNNSFVQSCRRADVVVH